MDEVTTEFHGKQINHRRTVQAPLERKFRDKQVQESYVKKSREKYESDCVRIRSYTQQITFMTGADLQKVQQKLARTQQTLQGNEKDYAKFTKELLELIPAWEKEWKEFGDSCQDLEEERLDFMKDIIWAYANAISTVCVADDLVKSVITFFFKSCLIGHHIVLRAYQNRSRSTRDRKGCRKLRKRVWFGELDIPATRIYPL